MGNIIYSMSRYSLNYIQINKMTNFIDFISLVTFTNLITMLLYYVTRINDVNTLIHWFNHTQDTNIFYSHV